MTGSARYLFTYPARDPLQGVYRKRLRISGVLHREASVRVLEEMVQAFQGGSRDIVVAGRMQCGLDRKEAVVGWNLQVERAG